MKQVWKYPLENSLTHVRMPINSEVLSVGVQNGDIFLWTKVNPEQKSIETRSFRTVGTGYNFDSFNTKFIGTVFLNGGNYVFEEENV